MRPGIGGPPVTGVSIEEHRLGTGHEPRTVAECHDLVHGIKDHGVFQHPVVVELSKVLDLSNPALIELKVVLFETKGDRLNYGVDHANDEVSVVPVNGAQQDGEEMDVAIFDLSRFRKDLVEDRNYLRAVSCGLYLQRGF
jgi:hypothetical protein